MIDPKMIEEYEKKIKKQVTEWKALDLMGFANFAEQQRMTSALKRGAGNPSQSEMDQAASDE